MRLGRHCYQKMSSGITTALKTVRCDVDATFSEYCRVNSLTNVLPPCLIAVSKTKPVEDVIEAYNSGHRDFGENYVQELVQKASHIRVIPGNEEIAWHFIGNLQKNKVNNLLGVANLSSVQTISNTKLADVVNKTWSRLERGRHLDVFVQVNTSGEENKGGCDPKECCNIVEHVRENCYALQFVGLMTIGAFNHDYVNGPNPDFITLANCRKEVCEKFGLDERQVKLSMGMSNDYKEAIMAGATHVRVGSTIFGARTPKPN